MRPIRITAHIAGGIVFHPAEGIAIDGPLAWAAVLERLGEEVFVQVDNAELARRTAEPDPGVPLAVHREGGLWMYKASLAELVGYHGTDLRHWNKRFDDAFAQAYIESLDLARSAKIQTNSGEFKSYHQPIYVEAVERLVWYAVGEPDKVRQLLDTHITHLGKHHNRGYGVVAAWEVEPCDGPEDRWLWREDGTPARAIPTAMLDDWTGEVAWAGYRPPYWLAAHQAWCAVPNPVEATVG